MRVAPYSALLWGVAALMVAGIVHLASILILPHVATDDAFSRLVGIAKVNGLTILPSPGPGGGGIPFRDPAVASAICLYDLREGGLRIGAAVGDAAFLAISFHTPNGVAFYALTNRSENEGRIDMVLVTPAQLEKIEAAGDDPVNDIRVRAPDARGFVEFDALPRIGGDAAARQVLNSAVCKLERDP